MKALWLRIAGVVIGLGSVGFVVCFSIASWFVLFGIMMVGDSGYTLLALLVLIFLNFVIWRFENRMVVPFARRLMDRASAVSDGGLSNT